MAAAGGEAPGRDGLAAEAVGRLHRGVAEAEAPNKRSAGGAQGREARRRGGGGQVGEEREQAAEELRGVGGVGEDGRCSEVALDETPCHARALLTAGALG